MDTTYDQVLESLQIGCVSQLQKLSETVVNFPNGKDDFLGRPWIVNAVDVGKIASIEWMIASGVDVNVVGDDGYTPLLSAIERNDGSKPKIVELLLLAGANPNRRGINDYTSAHLAAVRNDVDVLKILATFDADFNARTAIDNYATPLEEARFSGATEAVAFLECKT